jgi:Glycosyl hydrolase family 63 C-terminal domain
MGAESDRVAGFGRLEEGLRQAGDWYRWGPYVSERQWGTVREDYSADGQAWDYLPHDHARSRAYRWGEDGLAGFSDIEQRLCLGLALWNGQDPILKERLFGLTGSQGNHGEDVKEYWWYLDAVPSHTWNRWRYHYPQRPFPYDDLIRGNAARDRTQPEYELADTGVFDGGRYWITEVHYAKADPDDILMSIEITNAGPDDAELHVLPTAWFRNTWSWDADADRPELTAAAPGRVTLDHPLAGPMELLAGAGPDGRVPEALFCDNETNVARLFGSPPTASFPKDGINDHVVSGAATVSPAGRGTKCAFWYRVALPAHGSAQLRIRLRPVPAGVTGAGQPPDPLGAGYGAVLERRRAEADEFYAELTPSPASPDEGVVLRQALAGMLWSKQLYYYDVRRWLDGDPALPAPPAARLGGRNSKWRSFDAFDIMSMPDKWEYPWFAAWDLSFHCVALAHVDPAFAKYQLILLCREWFQHPGGALPAYEWDFSDVNPPVQAWAALEVFAVDGCRDVHFLSRVFDKLLVNFTWWVNREDAEGNNLFEGGFLGLDNIGPIDRSHLPVGGVLEQADATGWMAFYALAMGTIAQILRHTGHRPGVDLTLKFVEHFAAIKQALDDRGLWDEADGLYYDRLITPDGDRVEVKVRSIVSVLPALAMSVVGQETIDLAMTVGKRFAALLTDHHPADPSLLAQRGLVRGGPGNQQLLLTLTGPDRLQRLLGVLLDEAEFLSPHGLRALSAWHRDHPYTIDVEGYRASIDYGGNSNWRGPVWFPVNYLVISTLERYHLFFGDEFTVEYPARSGHWRTLGEVAADLQDRLISVFTPGADGRRPCFGDAALLRDDPAWRDNLVFSEYFNGDTAAGLGASHQTGWTGLIADIIRRRHGAVPSLGAALVAVFERA